MYFDYNTNKQKITLHASVKYVSSNCGRKSIENVQILPGHVFQHFYENVLQHFHVFFIMLGQLGDIFCDVLFVGGKVLITVRIDKELVDTALERIHYLAQIDQGNVLLSPLDAANIGECESAFSRPKHVGTSLSLASSRTRLPTYTRISSIAYTSLLSVD